MKNGRPHDRWSNPAGTTLIELMIAVLILVIVSAGLLGVFDIAISQNKQQGEFATRVTEYCQDKMEQLMALQYTDTSSNTAQMPWSAVTYSSSYAAWNSATNYGSGSNVNYNGTSYVSNITSNLAVAPGTTTSPTGGTGLTAGGTITASGSPPAGAAGYYDYLDVSGNLQGTANYAGPFYLRMWQITTSGNVKTITVSATTITNAGLGITNGMTGNQEPVSTLVCLKACPGGVTPC